MQVTPEILRELNNSRNRGDKEDDLMSIYILIIIVVRVFSSIEHDISYWTVGGVGEINPL